MAKSYNSERNISERIKEAKRALSNLLFAYLQRTAADLEVAKSDLAKHLNVEISDIDDWLNKKTLPSAGLVGSISRLIRGDSWHPITGKNDDDSDKIEDSSWSKMVEIVGEIENIQALQVVKLTQPKPTE